MKQISVVRKVLRERGYLVLWQPDFVTPFYVGRLITEIGGEGFHLGNFMVRGKTTKADFLEQQRMFRKADPRHFIGMSPLAQLKSADRFNPKFWRVTRTKAKGDPSHANTGDNRD